MTETELAAERAWIAMQHDLRPMPAGVALDMVQDVAGDRDEAVSALLRAGADWLAAQDKPPTVGGEIESACLVSAESVVACIREEATSLASDYLGQIDGNCQLAAHPNATIGDRLSAVYWQRWAKEAQDVIGLCRAISAAAYPADVV